MNLIHNILLLLLPPYLCKAANDLPNKTSHHTDFCPRLQKVYDGEILVENALSGLNISAALSLRNGETEPIWKIMLDTIARLGKFNVIYTSTGGIAENQTWSDKLYAELEIYDIYVDWWSRNMERLNKGILFPEGWWEGDTIMIVKTEEKKSLDFWAFAAPFSGALWILIVCVTLVTGMVYVLLDYLRSRRTGDLELDSDMQRALYLSMNAFVGHSEFDPKGTMMRVLTLSMNFMFLILLAAYTANLASFLVVKNSSRIEINQFDDVMKLRKNVCVLRGYPYIKSVSTKYPGSESLMIPFENEVDMYQALQNGECLVLLSSMEDWRNHERDAIYNINCGMKWAGRRVEAVPASFALRTSFNHCRALLHDVLDFFLIKMRSDGTLQEVWDNYRDFKLANTCDTGATTTKTAKVSQLNVFNMAGIFLFHLAILIITIIGEIFLFCCSPTEHKQTVKKEIIEGKNSGVEYMKRIGRSSRHIEEETPDDDHNVPSTSEDEALLATTEGAPISRREVALHIEKMEQRFATDLKQLKNHLNFEQSDHASNSDTTLSNSPNASQCSS